MKRLLFFISLCLFTSCKSGKSQSNLNDLNIILENYTIVDDVIKLNLNFTNNSNQPITILKPRPLKKGGYFFHYLPPDFFSVKLLNQKEPCVFSEPANAGSKWIKSINDFIEIPVKENRIINLNCSDYDAFYCGEETLDIEISYQFDERFLERSYFDKRIAKKGKLNTSQADAFFNQIKKAHRGTFKKVFTIRK